MGLSAQDLERRGSQVSRAPSLPSSHWVPSGRVEDSTSGHGGSSPQAGASPGVATCRADPHPGPPFVVSPPNLPDGGKRHAVWLLRCSAKSIGPSHDTYL